VIGYDDVVGLFSAACPGFASSPEAPGISEEDGPYVWMGHLVTYLIRLLREGTTECLAAVFGVAEQVLLEGDEEARRLIVTGFLHDLASADSYRDTTARPHDFEPWVGPVARYQPPIRRLLGGP